MQGFTINFINTKKHEMLKKHRSRHVSFIIYFSGLKHDIECTDSVSFKIFTHKYHLSSSVWLYDFRNVHACPVFRDMNEPQTMWLINFLDGWSRGSCTCRSATSSRETTWHSTGHATSTLVQFGDDGVTHSLQFLLLVFVFILLCSLVHRNQITYSHIQ